MQRILIENESAFIDKVELALQKAFEAAIANNINEVSLVCATRGNLLGGIFQDYLGETRIKNLLKGEKIHLKNEVYLSFKLPKDCTSRDTPKVLLAGYLSLDLMDIIDANTQLKAVVFLPWNADEGKRWLSMWVPNVEVIGSEWATNTLPFELSDEIEKVLASIIFKSVTHPNDKDRVKTKLKDLKTKGYFLNAEDAKSWAIKNGWAERDAKNLADIAGQVFKN